MVSSEHNYCTVVEILIKNNSLKREENLLFPSYVILQVCPQFNCMQLLHKTTFDLAL